MLIDYHIHDGPRGGLSFNFIPANHAFTGSYDFDRHGSGVFNVREEAFLFIEGAVAQAFPAWTNGHRYGVTWLSKDTWLDILARLTGLRYDLQAGVHLKVIVRKHVIYPQLLLNRYRLHRRALLIFLDDFERSVQLSLEHQPYLIIGGI